VEVATRYMGRGRILSLTWLYFWCWTSPINWRLLSIQNKNGINRSRNDIVTVHLLKFNDLYKYHIILKYYIWGNENNESNWTATYKGHFPGLRLWLKTTWKLSASETFFNQIKRLCPTYREYRFSNIFHHKPFRLTTHTIPYN